jgi:hypothetical protein
VDTSDVDAEMKTISDYVDTYSAGMKRISQAAGSLANESIEDAKTLESMSSNSKLLGEKVLLARGVEVDPEATVFIQVHTCRILVYSMILVFIPIFFHSCAHI